MALPSLTREQQIAQIIQHRDEQTNQITQPIIDALNSIPAIITIGLADLAMGVATTFVVSTALTPAGAVLFWGARLVSIWAIHGALTQLGRDSNFLINVIASYVFAALVTSAVMGITFTAAIVFPFQMLVVIVPTALIVAILLAGPFIDRINRIVAIHQNARHQIDQLPQPA